MIVPRPTAVRRWARLLALAAALAGCGPTAAQLQALRQRADAGDADAQVALARSYAAGEGIDPNPAEAASLYRKAAITGHPQAQLALGLAYREGIGVPQDDQEALRWVRTAAGSGEPRAQALLGVIYEEGAGVPRDLVAAHAWLNLAAAGLPPEERERAVRHRDWLAGVMTPAQIAEAQRRAREWAPQRP
ncbi:MAG: sel1 repeat family protein [Deltaproteobacteria bacterium]|nr:sel1 repeat family protein [Deltaproteobacteria bacterium]